MNDDGCTCWVTDPATWDDVTGFGDYDVASQWEQNPDCPVHPMTPFTPQSAFPDEAAHQAVEAEMAAEADPPVAADFYSDYWADDYVKDGD